MDRNWYEKKLLAKQLHTYYSVLQEGLSVLLAPWLRRAAESEMFVSGRVYLGGGSFPFVYIWKWRKSPTTITQGAPEKCKHKTHFFELYIAHCAYIRKVKYFYI